MPALEGDPGHAALHLCQWLAPGQAQRSSSLAGLAPFTERRRKRTHPPQRAHRAPNPPGLEPHHQAALGAGDLRAGTGEDTLTSGLGGLAAPFLSLPEPHLTPRLPLRSLGNRNAPMTPSDTLAGSLPLRRVNIHEFPPRGQQVDVPVPCRCTLCPLGGP